MSTSEFSSKNLSDAQVNELLATGTSEADPRDLLSDWLASNEQEKIALLLYDLRSPILTSQHGTVSIPRILGMDRDTFTGLFNQDSFIEVLSKYESENVRIRLLGRLGRILASPAYPDTLRVFGFVLDELANEKSREHGSIAQVIELYRTQQ